MQPSSRNCLQPRERGISSWIFVFIVVNYEEIKQKHCASDCSLNWKNKAYKARSVPRDYENYEKLGNRDV